jgi:uncharacterized protein (TIGR04255 family)
MGDPLKKPPVYFTLAQVRFNALLKLAEYLPSIQDAMRKSGFPDFVARKSVVIQITMQDGQAMPIPATQENFFFGNADKTHCFVLNAEALALQSTDYGTFEDFSAMLLRGLALVDQVVQLDFTERVGLRYLDHVTPAGDDILANYLAPEVIGLSSKLGGKSIHSFSETFNALSDIRLRSRVVIQNSGLSFPPDLQPEGMLIDPRFLTYTGLHALVDIDGFVEGREVFSADTVSRHLDDIHKVVKVAFRATVTEHAFKVWDEL